MSVEGLYPPIRPTLDLNFARSKSVDPRITFSRASAATYYDGRTVAKAEENLLTYSEQFDNSAWGRTTSSVAANAAISPDGTVTANMVVLATGTSSKGIARSIFGGAIPYTLSVYAKAGTQAFIQLSFNYVATHYANFDLLNGTLGTVGATVSASIAPVGNGWYRCTLTRTDVTGVNACYIEAMEAATSGYRSVTSSTGAFYLWGAQLEQRSQVTAYTPTTTQPITNYIPVLQTAFPGVPRIDHDPVTGECKGLLIEEQRTNLLTYSEQFDNAAWGKNGSGITPNTAIAPDGTLSADTFVVNQTSSFGFLYHGSVSQTGVTTSSIYAKKGSQKYLQLLSTATSAYWANFDLEVGTAYSGGTASASIVSVGDGWYRCVMSVNDSNQFTIGFVPSLTSPRAQTSTLNTFAYIWGAQMEVGAFPTSYIKTEASQVTRAADSASMTGANFSSWYRQDEGSLAVQGSYAMQSGFTNFQVGFPGNAGFDFVSRDARFNVNGTTVAFNTLGSTNSVYAFFVSGAYKNNDFSSSLNGSVVTTSSAARVGVASSFVIFANINSGHIKRITYYPKRLTDAQLQALTT